MALRRCIFAAASLGALAASTACSDQSAASASPVARGGGDPKLQETLAPPAPLGEVDLNIETLAEGLVNPWCVAFLPDGSILVTEREGRLRVIRNGALAEKPVGGVPEVYVSNQAGLFDILPHPDFSENGIVFLSYAHGTATENALRVARASFDGENLSNLEVLYEAKPLKNSDHHYGGRLVIAPDGTLFFSVGEGSRFKEKAQDMTSSFGAVIHLNQDGTVAENNPGFGEDALPELWTKGHRNPQGLAYDAGREIMWETEHGPRGGDEINIIERGENYGWPLATYGIDYNGARVTPFTEYEGTKQPFKYWTPSIGPSGLAVYYGDLFPDWKGDLFIGAMKAGAQSLHRIDLDESGREIGEERYLDGERIRDVRAGPGGAPVGKVLRLTPQP